MTGASIHVQDRNGKMRGRVSLAGKTPPSSAPVPPSRPVPPEPGTPETAYDAAYDALAGPAPRSTGKDGTGIPPLVVEIPGGGRFYVAHPDDRAAAVADIDRALAEGKAFPSVTTVIGSLDKPALLPWAAGEVANASLERLAALHAAPEHERQAMLDAWLEPDPATGKPAFHADVLAAWRAARDTAASRGTETHALAEAIAHGLKPHVPEPLRGYVRGFLSFLRRFPDMRFAYTEATVLNRADGTMGTADAIVTIGERSFVLDYKTNKDASVYATTGMQLAAAANGDAIVYPDGRQEALPRISGGIGVGLAPDGRHRVFCFETGRGGPNHEGLRAAVAAWRWQREHAARPAPASSDEVAAFTG